MEKINEIHLIGGVNKHQIDINPMMNWTLLVRISKQIVKVIQTDNNLYYHYYINWNDRLLP
jgi:hypothetical protein